MIMRLTTKEFVETENDYGYTSGYYSQNKKFWNGMHQKLIDKWNTRKPIEKIEQRLKNKEMEIEDEIRSLSFEMYRNTDALEKVRKLRKKSIFLHRLRKIVREEGGLNG